MEKSRVVESADRWLDAHNHDVASYEHVRGVLDRFDQLVTLAVETALLELYIPPSPIVYLDDYRKRGRSHAPQTPA